MATFGEIKQGNKGGIQGNDDSSLYKSQNNSGYQQLPQPDAHDEVGLGSGQKSKKNKLICGLVSLLLLIVVIVIIAIEVGGGKKNDDDGGGPQPVPPDPPAPPPPDPVVPIGFNPYIIDTETPLEESGEQLSGLLLYMKPRTHVEEAQHESFLKTKEQHLVKNGFTRPYQVGVETEDVTNATGVNNDYIRRVNFTFGQADYTRTVFSLRDQDDPDRFEIPEELVAKQQASDQYKLSMNNFEFENTGHSPFSFSFKSTRTGETMIDTKNQTFVFQDKYIQVDMKMPSPYIYGFGDRLSSFQMGQGAWTMWGHDQEHDLDHGRGGKQLASMHPFCLIKSGQSDEFMGIFFRSSNAQAPIISYDKQDAILSYITTGGNLDINFFFKGSAKEIIANYQHFIGYPKLPPFWGLGFSVQSNEWDKLDKIQRFIDEYQDEGIDLENIWLDGQYMDNHATFTVDNVGNFTGLKEYVEFLREEGKNVILTLYGGLSNDKPNKYRTKATGSLIMKDGEVFDAKTYSDKTVFLDWFHENSTKVWEEGLFDLFKLVPFSGIQLTMNAPTLFCDGGHPKCVRNTATEPSSEQLSEKRQLSFSDSKVDTNWYTSYGRDFQVNQSTYYLPFIGQQYNLDASTIALNATHNYTKGNKTFQEYDVHALFGHMQAKLTHDILGNRTANASDTSPKDETTNSLYDKRLLISSTSTFAGTGSFAGHHITGQKRTFDHMKYSIASMMRFNMMGMPFTGADVCAAKVYTSNQTEWEQQEICARWYQLSTFYPLARTNRDKLDGGIDVLPFTLPGEYENMAKYSISDRYMYAQFVYECLFAASQSGQTCFDPLLYHYPSLPHSYSDIEHTFIINDAIKVSPVLQSLVNETAEDQVIRVFFPYGKWVDLDSAEIVNITKAQGDYVMLKPGLGVKKHLRPGYIVPLQYNQTALMPSYANSTKQLNFTTTNLFINRDESGFAKGKVLFDDGISKSAIENKTYEYFEFSLVNRTLKKTVINTDNKRTGNQKIGRVIIYDAEDLQNITGACYIGQSAWKAQQMATPVYDEINKTLTFTGLDGTIDAFEMSMIQLTGPNDTYNFCDVYSSGWYVDPDSYDDAQLDDSEMVVFLKSDKYDYNMELALQMGDGSYDDEKLNRTLPIINVQVSIVEGDQQVFTVPEDIVDVQDKLKCTYRCKLREFVEIDINKDPKQLVKIYSNDTVKGPQLVWALNAVILEDFVNVMSTEVYTRNQSIEFDDVFYGIMGLTNRHQNDLFLPDGVYSLWTRHSKSVHPFYMAPAQDHTWFGVYTNLADASDWWVENNATSGTVNLTTIASGGIVDISIMFGLNPNEVTQRYHDLVGRPVLTPLWSLGWGQSRYGYKNTTQLREVKKGYEDNNLPLDSLWSDVDYMDNFKAFTIDPKNYSDLPTLVEELHNNDIHYVPILEPGIAQRVGSNYSVYNSGVETNVFIKSFFNGSDFTGKGTAGDVVYPDFFHDDTIPWWKQQLETFYNTLKFDGLWLDANEPRSMCNGPCYVEQVAESPLKNQLPYVPNGGHLDEKTIALDAWHNDTTISKHTYELDAHSLFGTMQTQNTHKWFEQNNKRTMIVGKSSFAGMGKWGSQWLGRADSEGYEYMGYSVTGTMMQNIQGIPLTGADVCGNTGNTNASLCTRWYSIGAYYPLSRNHNGVNNKLQEPYLFQDQALGSYRYVDLIRIAMQTKMALVNYYYTEMSMLHEEGGAFYRPLFFDFPYDDMAYQNQTLNVMLGKHLKLSHQSSSDMNHTDFYFPEGEWCSVFNVSIGCITGPMNYTLSSQMYQTYVHIREGSIVPLQTALVGDDSEIRTTAELQANPIDLHIHPTFQMSVNASEDGLKEFGGKCVAEGRFLNDDGEVFNVTTNQNRYEFNFTSKCQVRQPATNIELLVKQVANASNVTSPYGDNFVNMNDHVGKIVIYNADSMNFNMTNNYWVNVTWANQTDVDPWRLPINATFNPETNQTVLDGGSIFGAEVDLPLPDIYSFIFGTYDE